MKTLLLSIFLILTNTPLPAQNIRQALTLKHDQIGEYLAGELRATDTLVDLGNGYYEEFSTTDASDTTVIKQAAIFRNQDGTTTLGISRTEYDFVCIADRTDFYEIAKAGDSIHAVSSADVLPYLAIRELVSDTIIAVLQRYLPQLQGNYLDATATLDQLLSEVYFIDYLLPRYGTHLIATLGVCDYIPRNEINISAADWSLVEQELRSIELEYDRVRKRFIRR